MKKTVVFTLGLVLAGFMAIANGQQDPDNSTQEQGGKQHKHGAEHKGKGGGDRMAHMQQRLGLSDDQVKQMREIRARGGNRDEMRAVLNDEQRATMDAHRAQRQAEGGKGGQGGKSHGQGHGKNSSQDSSQSGDNAAED